MAAHPIRSARFVFIVLVLSLAACGTLPKTAPTQPAPVKAPG